MNRSVVITGLGPLCSIADSPESFWNSLRAGTRAITPIDSFDASGFTCPLAGQVDAKVRQWVPKSYRKATKVMARDTELAVIAAKIAADDAGLLTNGSEESDEGFKINPTRTGCQIGAGLIAADTAEMSRAVVTSTDESGKFCTQNWGTQEPGQSGMNNLPPLWLLNYLPNMPACHVTIIHSLCGPSNTIMGAEAGALLSIIESTRVIQRDSADMCLTGGAESRLNPLGLLRWDYAGRLANLKDTPDLDPTQILKPFDPGSLGSVMGEAGGMLVVEEESHAQARNARPYARISGYASTQSLNPILPIFDQTPSSPPTPPKTPHDALANAITLALKKANLDPSAIDAILPLGIAQPQLDDAEQASIIQALGQSAQNTPIVTLSDRIGNTLSAHGGLMTASAALMLHHQQIPANSFTLASTSQRCSKMDTKLNHVLICTSSLAGQCAALVLSKV